MLPQRWTFFKTPSNDFLTPNVPTGGTEVRLDENANSKILVIHLVGAITLLAGRNSYEVRRFGVSEQAFWGDMISSDLVC